MGKVYFVGAGPGDPELITVKGRRIIEGADLVLYAGSLVPPAVLGRTREGARVEDSSSLTLDEIHSLLAATVRDGGIAARVHTGDPSLFGALREQIRLLDRDGVPWEVVPGVTAAFAAAAAAGVSFTVPEATQTLILTRMAGRTPAPESERLRELAAHGSSLAVYLSAGDPQGLQAELLAGGLAPDTAVILACRIGWPGGRTVRCRLDGLAATLAAECMTRQTTVLVLPGESAGPTASKLYDPDFSHGCRG